LFDIDATHIDNDIRTHEDKPAEKPVAVSRGSWDMQRSLGI